MLDLCNTKQGNGENFSTYLQRLRALSIRLPWRTPEKQLVHIFIQNLNQEMAFHLQVHCASTFDEIIEKCVTIKKELIEKGLVKIYNLNDNNKPSNDKPKFWAKNKNIIGDGATNSKFIQIVTPKPKEAHIVQNVSSNVSVSSTPPK